MKTYLAITFLICVTLSRPHALSGKWSMPDCGNCSNGVCLDTPPLVGTDNNVAITTIGYTWEFVSPSGQYCLYVWTAYGRKLTYKSCGGEDLTLMQILYYEKDPVLDSDGNPVCYAFPNPTLYPWQCALGLLLNKPPTSTGTPPPAPIPGPQWGYNCYGHALGMAPGGPGAPGIPDNAYGPTTPPPGGGVAAPAGSGLTGTAAAVGKLTSSGSCYEEKEGPCDSQNGPGIGGIVMVYEAPVDASGNADMSKLRAKHVATSNGGAPPTYSSKNGHPPLLQGNANWDDAIGGYEDSDPSDGTVSVVKCFDKKAGC